MAFSAQATQIQRGDGATPTEVFATIGEVASFSGPGGSASVIDRSHLQSTAKEKLVGLKDEGQLSLTVHYDPSDTQQAGLKTDRDNQTKRNFKIIFADAGTTTLSFAGYVLGLAISGSVDDKVSATITIEIDGPVTQS